MRKKTKLLGAESFRAEPWEAMRDEDEGRVLERAGRNGQTRITRRMLRVRTVDLEGITNWDELAEEAGTDPKKLAELCGVRLRTLERFFERKGTTPEAFLMRKKHERCLAFFKKGMSVKEAADKADFADQFTFSKSFKKYMGVPPSVFRISSRQISRDM